MLYRFQASRARREWTRVQSLDAEMHARIWDSECESAAPLVLVAGMGMSSRYWVPLGRRLAGRFRVLAPDLPGFGRSPKPPAVHWPGGPNVRRQADQLLAWLDARGLHRVVLCGHSSGCQTVADLAARYPDRVEKLILLAPVYEVGHRTVMSQLPRLLLGALFETPSLYLLLSVEYGSAGPIRVAQQGLRMMDDPIERTLPHIDAPTLVVRGRFDPLVSRGWAQTITSGLRQATLVEIDRVGHAMQYSAPAVTADVISEFLQGDLDVMHRCAEGAVVAPQDDGHRHRFGPPQPISPGVHGALDYVAAAVTLGLPRVMGWGLRTRQVLALAAMSSTASTTIADHGVGLARKVPMVTHANLDIASGMGLLLTSATYLRREARGARWTVAALGLYQIAVAAMTAKPTGPARSCDAG